MLKWSANTEADLKGYEIHYAYFERDYNQFLPVVTDKITEYEFFELQNNQKYKFMIRAIDYSGNKSSLSNEVIDTPVDKKSPDSPSKFALKEVIDNRTQNYYFDLSWVNPKNLDFQGVKLIRKIGSAPSGPEDGLAIFVGKDESYKDENVIPGREYYYAIYSFDEIPNYSLDSIVRSGLLNTVR